MAAEQSETTWNASQVHQRLVDSGVVAHFEAVRETDSTNRLLSDRAREYAACRPYPQGENKPVSAARGSSLPDLSVVVADRQTHGRGRLDRRWESPTGSAILASIWLSCPGVPVSQHHQVTLMMGLSVCSALRGLGVEAGIKWPNDVLLHGPHPGKVCGILAQAVPQADGVVLGFGLNVDTAVADLPPGGVSLRAAGLSVSKEEVFSLVVEHFSAKYRQWCAVSGDGEAISLSRDISRSCLTLGAQIRAHLPGDVMVTGQATELTADGALVVQQDSGKSLVVNAGDVVHVRPKAPLHQQIYQAEQLSDQAGVPLEVAESFWRALGFPSSAPGEVAYGDADLAAMLEVKAALGSGHVDEEVALALTRATGRHMDRLTAWQVQILGDFLKSQLAESAADAHPRPSLEDFVSSWASSQGSLILYAWQRHLQAAAARQNGSISPEEGSPEAGQVRTVGFADLCGYTALTRRLGHGQLAKLVACFEQLVTDTVVAGGGAVVKTIGDEVLFAFAHADDALRAAGSIRRQTSQAAELPSVRIALATGPTIGVRGDVYGVAVNRASRMVSSAEPNEIWADQDTYDRPDRTVHLPSEGVRTQVLRDFGEVDILVAPDC